MSTEEPSRRLGRIWGLAAITTVLALVASAWFAIDPALRSVGRIEADRLPKLTLIQQAEFADLEASIALRNALLLRDAAMTRIELDHYQRLEGQARAALEALAQRASTPQGRALLDRVRTERERLQRVRAEAVKLSNDAPEAMPPDPLTRALQQGLESYLETTRQLRSHEEGRLVELVGDAMLTTERAQWLLLLSGCGAAATLLLMALSWRTELRAEIARKDGEIRRLSAQRDALVREVHHRIKNHLQGLLALMETQQAQRPEAAGALQGLQGHVLALMGMHGLQASRPQEPLTLRDLAGQQLALIHAGWPGARLRLRDEMTSPAPLAEASGVAVALALGELVGNAVKHGGGADVELRLFEREGCPCVSVSNPLPQPRSDEVPSLSGGAGLQLIDALLTGIATVTRSAGAAGEFVMTMTIQPEALQPA